MGRSFLLWSVMVAGLASAQSLPASTADSAARTKEVVESQLLRPLAAKELKASRFTRAEIPPDVRRARVLDAQPRLDAQGHPFLTFVVDARHQGTRDVEASWRREVMTGCVYLEGKPEIFIERKHTLVPAALLLGRRVQPADPSICKPRSDTVPHT